MNSGRTFEFEAGSAERACRVATITAAMELTDDMSRDARYDAVRVAKVEMVEAPRDAEEYLGPIAN